MYPTKNLGNPPEPSTRWSYFMPQYPRCAGGCREGHTGPVFGSTTKVQLTHFIISGGEKKSPGAHSAPEFLTPFLWGRLGKPQKWRAKRAEKNLDPFFLENRGARSAPEKMGPVCKNYAGTLIRTLAVPRRRADGGAPGGSSGGVALLGRVGEWAAPWRGTRPPARAQ